MVIAKMDSSSSSGWSSFLLGSALTATAMLLYQNRTALISLFVELRDEFHDHDGESGTRRAKGTTKNLRAFQFPNASSSKALAMNEEEQIGFLADIVHQLWPYINIAGSDTIRATAEPMFQEMPGPLRTLHFTKIDLGTVPIRLDNVCVHDVDLESNTLAFDLDIVWDGNCDIKLKADLIGSFGVKSIKMKGRMSILMRPLVPTTSIVEAIQYGFINTPEISLKYSGLAHVADFQGIDQTITDILKSTITSMMVLPRRRLYKMDKASDFSHIHKPPLGVLRLTIMKGQGFVVEKGLIVDDVPDCYCTVKMGDIHHRTRAINDTLQPLWNETMDFVLSDHDQCLELECWDHDTAPLDADDLLGTAQTSPGQLILTGGILELPLQDQNRPNGAVVTVGSQVLRFTPQLDSLRVKKSSSDNDDDYDKHICGLLTIMILGAMDIPMAREEAAAFVQVTCASSKLATSAVSRNVHG